MWHTLSKGEVAKIKQCIFLHLYEQCNFENPRKRLSNSLRCRLEILPKNVRKEIASMLKDGCTPLFVACRRGHVEIVEYLITVCDVDIEQRGIYELPDSKNDRCVTPLWCAAISGKLAVIVCLVKHGADINAVSDTGSTPVGTACFMSYLNIVCYLVQNGADIQKGNYCGVTCLINSVKCPELCFFLLQKGANVNAKDVQDKTALHYAIQEGQVESAKLLLHFGADPHAQNRCGDDALQTACLRGNTEIFEFLLSIVSYPLEKLANSHELMGSTFLEEFKDIEKAMYHWKVAVNIRKNARPFLRKLPVLRPRSLYLFAKEFISNEELDELSAELTDLEIQSLLICERVLGPHHKHTVYRIKYRGAEAVDEYNFIKGVHLLKRVLEIRVEYDTILFSDTSATAQAVVHSYIDVKNLYDDGTFEVEKPYDTVSFQQILDTFVLLAKELRGAKKLLKIRPIYKKQQENFDKILRCVTYLIYLLFYAEKTKQQEKDFKNMVTKLVESKPRSAIHCDTLLHLSVSRLNTINESYIINDRVGLFPNVEVVKLLLDCGAAVNAVNRFGSTPLHIAANTYNFSTPVVELLLERGAHLDKPNIKGETPISLLTQNQTGLYLLQYVSLKCLAATAILRYNIPWKGQLPVTLEKFLNFHKP